MGVISIPAPAAGGVKSVQRGSAGGSGNVTITAVDITKSFVTVFGTASSGTIAGSGTLASTSSNIRPVAAPGQQASRSDVNPANFASTMSGGTNNLVTAIVQGFLANSTTLTVSGACRWEVVEFI
jgi:hypothetical protein